MEQTKGELRKHYKQLRNNLSDQEVVFKSNRIINHLFETDWYKQSNIIMTYINMKNEIITTDFIQKALKDHKRIVVPVVDVSTRTLILSELKDLNSELHKGHCNILEPKKEYIRKISPSQLDMVLVPGLVFDLQGYRIGYGGGYYDKLLSTLNTSTITIGVAFKFQIVPSVPTEEFDQKVDCIITEEGIINI